MADSDGGGEKKPKKRRDVLLSRDIVLRRLQHRHKDNDVSPLVTLQEVFEETDNKDRFIGDTMFWKYFEDIKIDRIYHTDSVEYRNLRIMCLETIFYLFFVSIFTAYVFHMTGQDVYEARQEQTNYWSGCNAAQQCRISEVTDHRTFWRWMESDFAPNAFTKYSVPQPRVANIRTTFPNNKFSLTWNPRFVGPKMSNVVLGSIRMRQLRVKANTGCEVTTLVRHAFPDCYTSYSTGAKSDETYSFRFAPTYLKKAFTYKDESQTQQVSISGTMNSYGGDGFMIDLPANGTLSQTLVSDLWKWDWLDRSTRAVIVELTTMNVNVNVIVNSRILFEFGSSGTITGSVHANAAQVFFFTPATAAGTGVFILQVILAITFLFFWFIVFYLMFKTCFNFVDADGKPQLMDILRGCKFLVHSPGGAISFLVRAIHHYLRYGWNVVDMAIIVLFCIHASYRIQTYAVTSEEKALAPNVIGHPNMFMPFSKVFLSLNASNTTLSILAIAMWVKLFKYLCMIAYFRLLVRVLERTAQELIRLSIVLLVVFFGFAVSFFVGFGNDYEDFSTLSGSFLVLFFLLIDGYKVEEKWFEPGSVQVMPAVFFIYIAVIYFVLLNIFIAVVLDAYATSNTAFRSALEKPNPMKTFLWVYFNEKAAEGIRMSEDEEIGMKSEELSIKLELLPGIVRRKWIEKKRKMRQVASESFAGMEMFPGEDLAQDSAQMMPNYMLPSSRAQMDKFKNPQPQRPVSVYDIPKSMLEKDVSRAQLQRLMDEDETLPLLLGETKANKVILKYRKGGEKKKTSEEVVIDDQRDVFSKIDKMERLDTSIMDKLNQAQGKIPSVPKIDKLAQELSGALTDVRNRFRQQLTGIIEATAGLFEHLVDLTQEIDSVRRNHDLIVAKFRREGAGQAAASILARQ